MMAGHGQPDIERARQSNRGRADQCPIDAICGAVATEGVSTAHQLYPLRNGDRAASEVIGVPTGCAAPLNTRKILRRNKNHKIARVRI